MKTEGKNNGHGGVRKGSGRKPGRPEDRKRGLNTKISPACHQQLTELMERLGINKALTIETIVAEACAQSSANAPSPPPPAQIPQ